MPELQFSSQQIKELAQARRDLLRLEEKNVPTLKNN